MTICTSEQDAQLTDRDHQIASLLATGLARLGLRRTELQIPLEFSPEVSPEPLEHAPKTSVSVTTG
jgi:hypothetical protein